MSRSRKKVWGVKDFSRSGTKKEKRLANKTVRQCKKEIPNGMSYKKLYESWNICDWKWIFFYRQEISDKEFYYPDYKYFIK